MRHFYLAGAVVAAALFGVACGGDDSDGSGGTTGSGGKGGSGGGSGGSTSGGSGGSTSGGAGGTPSGGSGGATGGASGSGGAAGSAGYPNLLSQAGLYSNIASGTLAADVTEYRPRYQLWSDSAEKKRWVLLPAGSKIDTSDMDYWSYPVGTKLFKEFTRDGKRLETRMIHKFSSTEWAMIAYEWNAGQTDATAVPAGVKDAGGTQHDIPSQGDCDNCHGKMKDKVLSFTAIQLSHQLGGQNLQDLITQSKLTNPPSAPFTIPGSTTAQDALGYLHANCGLCHNENSFVFVTVNMQLWLKTSALGAVTDTPTYKSTVNQATTSGNPSGIAVRIKPKDTAGSDVHSRMSQRGTLFQMPPVGTEIVDPTGAKAVADWINSL